MSASSCLSYSPPLSLRGGREEFFNLFFISNSPNPSLRNMKEDVVCLASRLIKRGTKMSASSCLSYSPPLIQIGFVDCMTIYKTISFSYALTLRGGREEFFNLFFVPNSFNIISNFRKRHTNHSVLDSKTAYPCRETFFSCGDSLLYQVPTGSDNVPTGSDDVPRDSDNVPEGSDDVPRSSDNVPEGSENVPRGSENVPEGSENVPKGSDNVREGSDNVPKGSDDVPKG